MSLRPLYTNVSFCDAPSVLGRQSAVTARAVPACRPYDLLSKDEKASVCSELEEMVVRDKALRPCKQHPNTRIIEARRSLRHLVVLVGPTGPPDLNGEPPAIAPNSRAHKK